jgi:hypothetical protein
MNQYRFEIPASIVVSVEAATLAEAAKLAAAIQRRSLDDAPNGYAIDLGAGTMPDPDPGDAAVLWFNDDGSEPRCVDGPEAELREAEEDARILAGLPSRNVEEPPF